MKRRLLQALSCALVLIPASGVETEELAPVIHLTLEQAAVPKGAPILGKVELENSTKAAFKVFQVPGGGLGERMYTALAFDQQGRPLDKTEYGQWLVIHPHLVLSRTQREVEPGHTLTDTADFSSVFKLDRAGTYRLQVERDNPLDEKVSLRSNIVTVEVK